MIIMRNIFDLLSKGYEELNEKTETELKEQLKQTKDKEQRKKIKNKIEDVQRMSNKQEAPKEESLDEVMGRRLEQRESNKSFSERIKKHVVDGQTGELVEVDDNNVKVNRK